MTIAHPLRKLTLLAALAVVAAPVAGSACEDARDELRAQMSFELGAPPIAVPRELPPLVAIAPGVQVVQGLGDEIFFVDGSYWARHGGGWYRAPDYRARWVPVEPRWVPGALVRIPPGYYRDWHPGRPLRAWRRPYGPWGRGWDDAGWHRAPPYREVMARRAWTEARFGPRARGWYGRDGR